MRARLALPEGTTRFKMWLEANVKVFAVQQVSAKASARTRVRATSSARKHSNEPLVRDVKGLYRQPGQGQVGGSGEGQ